MKKIYDIIRQLNDSEKHAFRLHMIYSSLEGIILGVLALNEYVFIHSLRGSNYQLAFLFQFSMMVFVFLFVFNQLRKRIGNKKKMLRITGLVTRLPLILLMIIPADPVALSAQSQWHYLFLSVFLVYFFGNIIIYPAINLLLKTNYQHENFGKLYSYATSLNKIIILLATFAYGLLLDADNYAFRYVFPIIGVLGVISLFVLSEIDYSKVKQHPAALGFIDSVKQSWFNMVSILKFNRPYLHFEIGFMIYGFSFMISVTIINIFFEDALHLNYSSVAFYKNAYNILAILLLPFFGKLLTHIDPRRFAALTFASLFMYILFLLFTEHYQGYVEFYSIKIYFMLVMSFLFYGIFAAMMALLWFIGSAYFCKPEEADDYQSVHLSLTGVRSLFAPVFGVYFYELMGFTGTFILTLGFLLVAMAVMRWSYRRDKLAVNS
ncbi:MAG TPA: MFS transporter [Bacteroidales bacterium]|nr:MFS transporter [Bacteroidales bacterium]